MRFRGLSWRLSYVPVGFGLIGLSISFLAPWASNAWPTDNWMTPMATTGLQMTASFLAPFSAWLLLSSLDTLRRSERALTLTPDGATFLWYFMDRTVAWGDIEAVSDRSFGAPEWRIPIVSQMLIDTRSSGRVAGPAWDSLSPVEGTATDRPARQAFIDYWESHRDKPITVDAVTDARRARDRWKALLIGMAAAVGSAWVLAAMWCRGVCLWPLLYATVAGLLGPVAIYQWLARRPAGTIDG